MNTFSSFFPLLFLALFVTVQPHLTAAKKGPAAAGLIVEVCKQTPYVRRCLDTFRSDLNSPKEDLKGLAYITFNIASINATATSAFIKQLMEDDAIEPIFQQTLTDCDVRYEDVVQQIEDSTTALFSRAFDDIQKWMKTAVDDIDVCNKSVPNQRTGNAAELSRRNRVALELCSNAQSIVSLVARK